uniref:Uncharacterized protein n=1 Tax=Parascaris equorum TaxID=6256 RepID=A0A914RFA0_PAREQ
MLDRIYIFNDYCSCNRFSRFNMVFFCRRLQFLLRRTGVRVVVQSSTLRL